MLIGGTTDEGALFLGGRRGGEPIEAGELGNIDHAAADAVFARYREAYPDDTALERRVRFISAEEYWVPTMRMMDARAATPGAAESYAYLFDWPARGGPMQGFTPHGAEIAFVWNTLDGMARGAIPQDAAVLDMHAMWVAFIAGGAPERPEGPRWPPYQGDDRRLMRIDEDLTIVTPDDWQLALWDGWL